MGKLYSKRSNCENGFLEIVDQVKILALDAPLHPSSVPRKEYIFGMADELAAPFKTMKHVSSLAPGKIRWNEHSYRRILVAANKPVRAEYHPRG